ncbi:hypothetical protein L873DRAFT_1723761 [Choiromyces venosus 120613-1]|uniref:Uncharacterized protein n=1 Tax=Choiromyces venosus 120613-1 TaxID=1336337 RepID=A0A3N4ITA7_9PEZI|nr:hypothetical protein L873DRAFT_1723761 [Choiromyces venosus 120613-1]
MSPGDINPLDEWIRQQSSKLAYSDITKGFIGKRALKEAICSNIPGDFHERGYTPEKVRIRLTVMMSEHLTSELLKECDARRIASMAAAGNVGTGGVAGKGHAISAGAAVGLEVPSREVKGGLPRALDKGKQRATDSEDRTKGPPLPGLQTSGSKTAIPVGAPPPLPPFPPFPPFSPFSPFPPPPPAGATASRRRRKKTPASEPHSPKLGVSDELIQSYKRAAAAGVQQVLKTTPTNGSASLEESTTTLPRSPSILSTSVNASTTRAAPSTVAADSVIPSLPFKLQYRIFTALQAILESCCYDFACRYYPQYLKRKSWDCPEAGELTAWIRGLSKEFSSNPVFDMGEDEFDLILKKGGEIRHAAVHRVSVSGQEIQRLIEDARAMAEILDDEEVEGRLQEIEEIKAVVDKNIQTLLDKRAAKEEKLRLELEKLERWKRDIELREVRAIKGAEEEEENIRRDFQDEIGRELEWLELEGKGLGVRDRGEAMEMARSPSAGPAPEDEEGGNESPATINEGGEEDFHEPEGWPAPADAPPEQLLETGIISPLNI